MQNRESILQIDFQDRLGLGYEVFGVLKRKNLNLLAMEAQANNGMIIKFQSASEREQAEIINELLLIEGVLSVHSCDFMPSEQRENQLLTILNSVSDGVIAINNDGKIIHFNDVASEILLIPSEKAIGANIETLLEPRIPILEILKTGIPYRLIEIKIDKAGKTFHYLTSGVPVLDRKGHVIGAVATIKDYKQVEEILWQVDGKRKRTAFDDIIFQSAAMRNVVETAGMVARGESSILLRGESGTGKEMFARAIHQESDRSRHPFIAINCAALPVTLLESELFGYEEGAFTGAARGGKKGLFEQADKGTLFLDEIGEISPQIQARLLRVLQDKKIRRVGGSREIPVDVRIIAATHRNLEDMIAAGSFREDLYYRLNVIPLRIPPLRERPEDIPVIAQHLIRRISAKLHKPAAYITKEAVEYLMSQPWPGNVRQLENTLERILNVTNQNEISVQHLYKWANLETSENPTRKRENVLHVEIPLEPEWPQLKDVTREVEKQLLLRVMLTHTSSRKAGSALGVSNTTILNKLKSHGIIP